MTAFSPAPASPLEERFDLLRRRAGFVLAPLAFAVVVASEFSTLSTEAHRLAAVIAAVIVLWVCESLPMQVTALVGAAACVVLRVAPANDVFAPFADQLMFLFIGSFIVARGIFLHGLDRRVALSVLSLKWVGARPSRVLFAFGAVTAAASAWVSNTAVTIMMFAIGLSILKYMFREQPAADAPKVDPRYATGLMLITTFAASIGGLATPVGTPPNVIGIRNIKTQLGVDLPFFTWLAIGVPVVVVMYAFLFTYMNWFCPAGVKELPGSRQHLLAERSKLGSWTAGQRSTVVAFLVMVVLWLTPGVVALVCGKESDAYQLTRASLPEAVAAIAGATLLFLLPGGKGRRAITWREAVEIDWGVVLLYGGGVALGVLANETGLANAVALGASSWLGGTDSFLLLLAATAVGTIVSEATSNTASASIVVPTVIAVAQGLEVDPLPPAIGATMGCSLGFMLPVSTPCNAIVYGSGYIPLTRMIRYGFLLDVVGVAVIVTVVWFLCPLVGIATRG